MSCIFITISGGQAAGKKTVQQSLKSKLLQLSSPIISTSSPPPASPSASSGSGAAGRVPLKIVTLQLRDFRFPLSDEEVVEADAGRVDLERRDGYDLDLLADTVERLKRGEKNVTIPSVDFKGKRRKVEENEEEEGLEQAPDVVIAEGCFLLCHKGLVDMAAVKIFVDCDPDVRLARRVIRDSEQRHLSLDHIFDSYIRHGKPAFEQSILPTKHFSDIILPGGSEGPGVELIAQGVMDDIKGKTVGRPGTAHTLSSGSVGLLPITLSEADLSMSSVTYYETV